MALKVGQAPLCTRTAVPQAVGCAQTQRGRRTGQAGLDCPGRCCPTPLEAMHKHLSGPSHTGGTGCGPQRTLVIAPLPDIIAAPDLQQGHERSLTSVSHKQTENINSLNRGLVLARPRGWGGRLAVENPPCPALREAMPADPSASTTSVGPVKQPQCPGLPHRGGGGKGKASLEAPRPHGLRCETPAESAHGGTPLGIIPPVSPTLCVHY